MSSTASSIRHVATTSEAIQAEHHISLTDHERTRESGEGTDAEVSDSEATPATPSASTPIQKVARHPSYLQQSLKRQWTKQKYAKYDRDRYDIPESPPEDAADQPQLGEAARPEQAATLERKRANFLFGLKRKRTLGTKDDRDTVVDILYENQRGIFFFGIPKYSNSGLLPSDPKPWQNAQFRTSPVDIRNAQVPDPSWEWAWKSWYVDMSRDVDEEGWEYSIKFNGGAWHGNHPWFHSFVRRRRWLRMRRRRDTHHHTREKAHELTAEYFTIHPKTLKAASDDMSRIASTLLVPEKLDEESDVEKMEIVDIGSLILALKKAPVDREKLGALRRFLNSGGEELYYLSDRMPEIMSLFVYQSSRRQLLADLLSKHGNAKDRRASLAEHDHDDDEKQEQHDAEARHTENLLNAIKAADEQVKKLEYWSDIKDMARDGEISSDRWDKSKWAGLSPVTPSSGKGKAPERPFAAKQAASEGFRDLHNHPEYETRHGDDGQAKIGKGKEKEVAPREKPSSVFFDAKTKDSSDDASKYSTAAESTSDFSPRPKGKSRLSNLDGVNDSEDTIDHLPKQEDNTEPIALVDPGPEDVQIVDPVPISQNDEEAIQDSATAPTTSNVGSSATAAAKAIAAIATGGNES